MLLFAQLAPLHDSAPSSEAVFFYLFGGCVLFSLTVVVLVGTIIHWTRRTPPIEADFPTKEEVAEQIGQVRSELHREIGGVKQQITALDASNKEIGRDIFLKLDGIAKSFNAAVTDIHRALGRLEGKK